MIVSMLAAGLLLADPAPLAASAAGMQDAGFLAAIETVRRGPPRFSWSDSEAWRGRFYHLAITGEALVRRQLTARGIALWPIEKAIRGDAPLTRALGEDRMAEGVADFIRRRADVLERALLAMPAADRAAVRREVETFVTFHAVARFYRGGGATE